MIIGKDIGLFLKKFFSRSSAQAFFVQGLPAEAGASSDLEDLLVKYLACEKKSFCKKCASCNARDTQSLFGLKKFEGDTLKIEDAREIHIGASQSGFSGSKIYLLKNRYIAPDAEATLLKTVEEPYPGTYFIFSGIEESALSRPLLSRLTVFRSLIKKAEKKPPNSKLNLDSLKAPVPGERPEAEEIFRNIEIWADEKIRDLVAKPPSELSGLASFIEDLYEAKKRFFEKTYSSKMLLEHLIISKYYIES